MEKVLRTVYQIKERLFDGDQMKYRLGQHPKR